LENKVVMHLFSFWGGCQWQSWLT